MLRPIHIIRTEAWKIVRFLLREKAAGIGAPLAFSVGLAMIYGDDFVAGTVLAAVADVWGIAAWLVSDELQKRKPQLPRKPKYAQIQKYNHARRRYLFWKWSIPIGILVTLIMGTLFVDQKREEKILRENEGFLLPANDPDPPSFCADSAGPKALKVFIGRNEAFTHRFPYTVLRVFEQDRIIIDRDSNGHIALSADILDDSGKVIVTFEKGHFTVMQANVLDMKRPDRSELLVRDQYKNEVLDVRYLNRNSIRFSGLLRYPGAVIPISKTESVNGICVGDVGGAAYAISRPK